jgi:hypothetical protein
MPAMDDELAHALEVGTVVLGGCVLEPDAPVWHCNACEHRWKDEPAGLGPFALTPDTNTQT